ncbi:Phosphatidylinositol 3-kinase regulatory subunit alpha [Bagarius yarrelli]|uniref:Phosphatidylinositol 3-kinase regulatory subunit alpha n=1 Tax=Bagarius yarrelli TaxID=175774 RepID=A0A556TY25_BAGYA|nr:Phosphatidylinositol 3-kinase regulatory subunit alpha [Bagarius yarrelli]
MTGCGMGDSLEQCTVPDQAPAVVLRLTEALERRDPAAVECEQYDLAVLADTLRAYLQELPCPIVPSVLYSELVYTAQEIACLEDCGQQLRKILDSPRMPQSNHQLLVYLTRHLSRVTQSGGASQDSASADVNPDHHVKILEALIVVGGLSEMQAAPALYSVAQTAHKVASQLTLQTLNPSQYCIRGTKGNIMKHRQTRSYVTT